MARRRRAPRKRRMVARIPRRIVKSRPVPDQKTVTLRYVAEMTLNAAGGSAAHHLFRANDMFDPDLTGAGHQPMGFDQWMTFYNHFTVVASTIKVTGYTSALTGPVGNAVLGIYLNDDVSSSNVMEALLEFRNTRHTNMGIASSAKSIGKVRHSVSLPVFFGKKNIVNATGFEGSDAASPIEQAIWDVFLVPAQAADDLDPVDCIVEIEYKAVLTERKTLTQS